MPKILIIDDEPFTVEMLQTFLQINSYETVGAFNGQDGIVLCQVESPDIVILDLMLPDLEGYDVCRQLRKFPPTAHLPVLILSARTAQVDKDNALAAGANGYLTKPVRFPDLLEELKRLLTARPRTENSPLPASATSSSSPTPGAVPAEASASPPITGPTNSAPARPTEAPKSAPSEMGTSSIPPRTAM